MENQQPENQGMEQESSEVNREAVRDVYGQNVTIRQGGMQSAKGDRITVRQGGILKAEAENLELVQGGVVLLRTQTASINASNAGIIFSGGDVNMDLSAAKVLVSGGNVTMDQSASVLMVANKLETPSASTVFLIARNVEGNVTTTFGQRESVLFAVVAGLVTGIVLSVAKLFRK
jgi:hypothetical protein